MSTLPEDHSNKPSSCPVCGLDRHQARFKLTRAWCDSLGDIAEKHWCQECNSFFVWDRTTGDVLNVETAFPNGALMRSMKGKGIAKHIDIVQEIVEVNEKGVRVYVFLRNHVSRIKFPRYRRGYVELKEDKLAFTCFDHHGNEEHLLDPETGQGDVYRILDGELPLVKKALGI